MATHSYLPVGVTLLIMIGLIFLYSYPPMPEMALAEGTTLESLSPYSNDNTISGMDEITGNRANVNEHLVKDTDVNKTNVNDPGVNERNVNGISVNERNAKDFGVDERNHKDFSVGERNVKGIGVNELDAKDFRANARNVNDISGNERNANGFSARERNMKDFSVNERNVKGISVDEHNAKDFSVDERNVKDSSILKDSSVNERNAKKLNTNKRNVKGMRVNKRKAKDFSVGERNVEDISVNERNVKDFRANERNVKDFKAHERNVKGFSANERNAKGINVNEHSAKDFSVDERNVKDFSSNKRILKDSSVNERNANNFNVDEQNVNNINMNGRNQNERNLMNERNVEDITVNEHNMEDISVDERTVNATIATKKNLVVTNAFNHKTDPQRSITIGTGDPFSYIEHWYNSIVANKNLHGAVLNNIFTDVVLKKIFKVRERSDRIEFVYMDPKIHRAFKNVASKTVNDQMYFVTEWWVSQIQHEIEYAAMTDAQDLRFLRDPFVLMNAVDESVGQPLVYVGSEYDPGWPWLESHYKKCIKDGRFPAFRTKQVFNSGFVAAKTPLFLEFIRNMKIAWKNRVACVECNCNTIVFNAVVHDEYDDNVVSGFPLHTKFKSDENYSIAFFKHKL